MTIATSKACSTSVTLSGGSGMSSWKITRGLQTIGLSSGNSKIKGTIASKLKSTPAEGKNEKVINASSNVTVTYELLQLGSQPL